MTYNRTLSVIVARGNVIISELNKLYDLVPAVYLKLNEETKQYLDREKKFKINDLICDFSYFKCTESFEAKIDSSDVLKKADEEFCDNYIDILTRFYLTFESVHRYAIDINQLVQDVDDDVFVGQSLDSLLSNIETRQLLCEGYFLLGYMLLTIDQYFESSLRESLIVSYYRYSSYKSSPSSHLDETCNLMRTTGFITASQRTSRSKDGTTSVSSRPEGYPENFLARAGVNEGLIKLLIAKLVACDLYSQTTFAFPHPDHRSTALSQQSSMLYVILYFCPDILISQKSRMREITDKFFYDNWMTSVYMGDLVNLIEAWNPYRAARESLVQLLDQESTRTLAEQYRSRFDRASRQLQDYLKEGWLDQERVLENHKRILILVREANVLLRWFMIHSHMRPEWGRKLTKIVNHLVIDIKPSNEELYLFLQNLAEIERKFLELYEKLFERRDEIINENRIKATETLDELISIFSDSRPMRYIQPGANTELVSNLADLLANIKETELLANEPVIKLINQFDRVHESYPDGKNLQVVQLFKEAKESLVQVLKSLSLTSDIKVMLNSIGNFSYAWMILADTFATHMQKIIKDDPLRVYGIEATFLKLASAFDSHILRIQQVDSRSDLMSVSKYYSSRLISHMRDVLHIIPATILEILSSIIDIQTDCVMGELPSKVELDELKNYALPEKRYQMLELTYKVSHYAESLILMQDTVVGLIKIDSRKLLEEGIRRELVQRISDSIRGTLDLSGKLSSNSNGTSGLQLAKSLTMKLTRLTEVMNGFRRSLEYVQDYLFIYGLRMWQEELARVVKFTVDQATGALLGKSYLQEFSYRSQADTDSSTGRIPIPVYDTNPLRSSFVVLLLDELLKITDPHVTIYDEQMSAWYEQGDKHDRVLDLKVFELIGSSLGIVGLNGLDQICSVLLMLELQRLDELLISIGCSDTQQSKNILEAINCISEFRAQLISNKEDCPMKTSNLMRNNSLSSTLNNNKQTHRQFSGAIKLLAPYSGQIGSHLSSVGQLQLIRMSISCVLSAQSRCEARNLYSCLDTLNDTLLVTLKHGSKSNSNKGSQQRQYQNLSSQHEMSYPSSSQNMVNNDTDSGEDFSDSFAMMADSSPKEATTTRVVATTIDGGSRRDGSFKELLLHMASDGSSKSASLNDVNNGNHYDKLDESQLIFELTNHLEWVGLSDPLSKIYTLSLQASKSSQVFEFRQRHLAESVMFLILLEQSSKFLFSKSISGFVPKRQQQQQQQYQNQSRAFFERDTSNDSIDGQPLFYGLVTILNHYEPFLSINNDNQQTGSSLGHLLDLMSFYARCFFDQTATTTSVRVEDCLTLESVNVVLSMIELIRIARKPVARVLASTYLPKYIFDVFQFTICQLNNNNNNNGTGGNTKATSNNN